MSPCKKVPLSLWETKSPLSKAGGIWRCHSGQENTPGLGCAEDSSLDTPFLCMKHMCFPLLPPICHPAK